MVGGSLSGCWEWGVFEGGFLLQVSEMLEVYVGVRLFWVVVNG